MVVPTSGEPPRALLPIKSLYNVQVSTTAGLDIVQKGQKKFVRIIKSVKAKTAKTQAKVNVSSRQRNTHQVRAN